MTPRRTTSRLTLAATALAVCVTGVSVPPLLGSAAAAEGCTKFAAPTGSDSASGTSTSPYRTATKLASSLGTGQVGCLATGSYTGSVTLSAAGSTLRSTPGQRATLNVDTLTIAASATDATVSDLNIVGNSNALTTRLVGHRFTFTRNDITNNNGGRDQIGSCILVADSSTPTRGGVITLNRIHECGTIGSNYGHGIYTQNVDGLLIEDNIIRGVGSYAVQLYPKAENVTVRHNVIDGGLGSIRGGIVIDGAGNNHRIEQNVIAHAEVGAVQARVGTGHASMNNCYWDNPSNASGNISVSGDITSDPGFANRSGGDYRLASGSACLTKVGYDTAAKIAGAHSGTEPAPTTEPTTEPTTAPTTEPTTEPAPAPTTAPSGAPVVSISEPTAGAYISGNDLWAAVRASDPDGSVAKVDLLIDGRLVATEQSAPYEQWISGMSALTPGNHTMTAVAHDDSGLTTRASVVFTTSSGAAAATAPVVEIESPTTGTRVRKNTLRALVKASSSTAEITKVELLVNGRLYGTELSAPYDQWLSLGGLNRGTHVFTAVAHDSNGRTTSESVTFLKR